jgi:hypothetical protein
LLHCYHVYAPYPGNTWREIHHLYRVAADLNCVSRQVPDPLYSLIDKSTAEDAYKQVLLRVCGTEGRCGDFVEAFLVLEVEAWKRPACLLVPGFLEHFFRPKVVVSRQGRETGYCLTRLIETTGVVALLEYVVDQLASQGAATEGREDREPGFENVWDIL